jgi:hypothetical protein
MKCCNNRVTLCKVAALRGYSMRMVALGWLLLCGLMLGCGDDGGPDMDPPPVATRDGGSGSRVCMDEDGDGFGRYCDDGLDCDDEDPEITDECRRCAQPNKGCPCPLGTRHMTCDPDDVEAVQDGVKGVLVCTEGARYCRDGAWSDCEIIWMYTTFVRTE